MEEFNVIIEEPAQRDLRGIFEYISDTLMAPQTAKNFMQRIRKAIEGLSQMPKRYPLYEGEPWRSQGIRRMNVENFATFYIVQKNPNIVSILAVIYGGRDIDRVLKEKLNS